MKANYTHHIDILALGPHPDDVEVGVGSLLHQEAQQGKSIVIVDLTLSQLSTHGTPELRLAESLQAAQILGIQKRINLGLQDLSLQDDEFHRMTIAKLIRTYRPRTILLPDSDDRHPDHRILVDIVRGACFLAGLPKIFLDGLTPFRPSLCLLYPIWSENTPDIIIPISEASFQAQQEAIQSYHSQFATNSHCFEYIRARAITVGFSAKQTYGLGLKVLDSTLSVSSLDHISSGLR